MPNESAKRRRLPKYVSEFQDRHGKWRLRFRRKGRAHYFECTIAWSAEFMQEYAGFLKERGTPPEAGASRTKVGTFDSLIAGYYREPMYTGKRESTRKAYRGIIERFRAEHGQKSVANIQRKHIAAIIGGMSATPGAANHLLDRLRVLMKLAIREGHRRDNPALDVEGFEEGKGFHSWTEEEIERFELRHPPRSKAHLALIIVLCTGQRRSDAVTMGWHKVTADGRLRVRQIKTDEELAIPVLPALREAIVDLPRDAPAFLMTENGKPFTAAGLGNWFRDRCDEAGLPHCSFHGLRKAQARRLAEAGCSNPQIKAITGHRTDSEVARYTRAADQIRLSDQAMQKLLASNQERKLSNQMSG